jgi:thiol-disulfide isomerase/thioredoxin
MIPLMRLKFWFGLPLGLALAGCSGLKPFDIGPRTTPSIGDRQLGVISGRPGEESIIRSNSITSTIDSKDARRISGRVIDHRGQPVSGATVRLADGALAGGAVSDVITDEAGGFTVRGLRASTPYTLIATLDLGGESRISRARFLSGETQARVLLEPDSNDQSDTAIAEQKPAARPKMTTAKTEAKSDQPAPPKGKWVFVEDEAADNTAKVSPSRKDRAIQRVSNESDAQSSETRTVETPAPKPKKNEAWRAADRPAVAPKADTQVRTVQYSGDDDQNPLPPAIERKPFVYEEFEEPAQTEVADRRIAKRSSRAIAESADGLRSLPDDLAPVTDVPSAEEILDAEEVAVERRPPRRAVTNTRPRTDNLYTDAPSAGNMRVEQIDEINRIRRAQRERQLTGRDGNDYETPARSSTWEQAQRPVDELARTDRTISRANRSIEGLKSPVDVPDYAPPSTSMNDANVSSGRGLERPVAKRAEIQKTLEPARQSTMVSQIEPDVARTDQERIDRLKATEKTQDSAFGADSSKSSEWINRMTGGLAFWKKPAGSAVDDKVAGVFCDFDSNNQRVIDFELPDIKGRPTRLSQMPSELTLLFFWGTWCKPCHEAMPHLVELQRRLASDNVQIIGIAYEEGAMVDRQKKVAMAADRYGVNFPLLMGGKGGADACPVRKSLGVQVYPTMVLLDRDGRVLWRDQGTTPATMGRLDRVLASHLREIDTKQVARSSRED